MTSVQDPPGFVADPPGFVPDDPPGFVPDEAPADDVPFGAVRSPVVAHAGYDPANGPAELVPLVTNEDDELAKDERARRMFDRAQAGNPTHDIEAVELARASGAPVSMVRDRIDDFRKSYKAAGTDVRKWRLDNPDLYQMLSEMPHMAATVTKDQTLWRAAANPEGEKWAKEHPFWGALFSSFAVDPLDPTGANNPTDPLGKTERVQETHQVTMQDLSHLGALEAPWDALKRSAKQNWIAKQGYARARAFILGDTDTERSLSEGILEQQQALGLPAYYGEGLGTHITTSAADATGGQLDSAGALLLGAVATAVTKRPQIGVQIAKIAGAYSSFVTETGGAYNDMADALDDQGKPIDKRAAFAAAHAYGALAAAIETGVIGVEAGGMTALDAKRWAGRMLTDKTKRGALLDLAKTLTKNAAAEGSEEGSQQALQLTIEWLAKSISAGEVQHYDKEAATREIVSSVGQGVIGSVVPLGVVTLASNAATQIRELGDSHRAGAHVAAINEVAKTDAAQAAPQEVAAFIAHQQQRDGRKVTHLYVDPTKVHEFAEKGGVDINDVATELMGPEGPQRLQDALDLHGDAPGARATLEVPLAEYLEKWGGKPIAEELAEHTTTGPGLQTPGELKLFQKSVQARADEIAKAEEIDSPEAAAVGNIEEQLVAAGTPKRQARLDASVAYAMAESLARYSGRKVEDVLAEMPSITGVGVATAKPDAAQGAAADVQTLKQPALEQMAAELRPVSADTLRQDFQALAPDEQQQRYFRDRNTGLANFRALETAWKDPSRQHLALFSLEGSKFLNDNFGHGSVDGALRAMADAVRQVAPDAGAKVGSDIGVMVRDEAQAKEVLDAMRRALPADVQVTYDIGARQETLKKTVDTVAGSHKTKRLTAEAAGTLAKRGDAPVALRGGDAKPVADKLTATAQPTVATPLSAEHGRAFAGDATAFETAHLDASGLISDDGFAQARANERTRKAFVMSADLRGFAGMNAAFGPEATDGIKAFFNQRMFNRGAGAFDAANLHGDEYAAQGDDAAIMDAFFKDAQKAMQSVVLWEQNEDGSISYQLGVYFAHGIARDEDAADRIELPKAKREQDASGIVRSVERIERGDLSDDAILAKLKDVVDQYAKDAKLVPEPIRVSEANRSEDSNARADSGGPRSQADQVADAAVERLKQTDDEAGDRGWIKITRAGAKRQFKIFLTKNADASTFLHESAHAYFEMLGDLAEAPNAIEALKRDWATARKWAGAKDGEALTVEQKEKLARGFEAYILEGKAPSSALAEVFASFRRWLVEIYKNIKSLGVELDDNIRGVFDRMLATEQEIERARTAAGLAKPVFSTPEQAGVDPKDFDTYLAAQERVRSDVTARTQRMIHEGEFRAAKAYKTEEFRRLHEQFSEEYDQLPETRAWRYMVMGEIVLSDGTIDRNAGRGKLDRDEVVAILGKNSKLVGSLRGRLTKGGENPIDVAEMFGFTQGAAEMLKAVASRPAKDTWVQTEAERAMRDKHPEIDGEIDDLQAAIQKLLHADSYDQAERDWQMVKRETNDQMTLEALAVAAKDKVANQAAGRLDPGVALNRERAAANEMAQAIAEGNRDRAMVFGHKRMLHKYMWRELTQAREMREKFRDLVGDMLTDDHRKKLGLAGPEYRDVHDTLLEAIGATPERESDERRKDLGALLSRMEADGNGVAFDSDFIGELMRKPKGWRDLKVSELQMVFDAMKNIKAAARNVTTLLRDGKRLEIEQEIDQAIEIMNAARPKDRSIPSSAAAASYLQKAASRVADYTALNLRPETILDELGLGYMLKSLNDAKHKAHDLKVLVAKSIADKIDALPKKDRLALNDTIDGRALFPDHIGYPGPPQKRFELLTMAFNIGNASNMERLTGGRNITRDQVLNAMSQLTTAEIELAQEVWDSIEKLWPELKELEERDSGMPLEKIQAEPVDVTSREGKLVKLRGGYFPAAYDKRFAVATKVGGQVALDNVGDAIDTSAGRYPTTNKSAAKARAKKFEDVISLEPLIAQAHISRVAHDIAFREPVRSMARVFLNPRFKQALALKVGAEQAKIFEPWLRDIGRMEAAQIDDHGGGTMATLRKLRSNLSIAVLGHKLSNYLADFTQLATALIGTKLKARYLGKGIGQFALERGKARAFAFSKSGELRMRGDDSFHTFARKMKGLAQGRVGRGHAVVQQHAFFFAEQIEKAIITPMWLGRYAQAQAEGLDDASSVAAADELIRQEFPAKSTVDKAAIQRDKGTLWFVTMFMGFANWSFNKYRRIWTPVLKAEGLPQTAMAVSVALMRHVALMSVIGPLSEIIVGHGPEGDEPWEEWYLRKLLIAHLMPLPIVGGLIEKYAFGRMTSDRGNPAFAALESAFKSLAKAADDDNEPLERIMQTMRALGYLTGLPTEPVRMSEYLLEGDYDNAGSIPSGLLYGDRKNKQGESVQPLNPISAFDQ